MPFGTLNQGRPRGAGRILFREQTGRGHGPSSPTARTPGCARPPDRGSPARAVPAGERAALPPPGTRLLLPPLPHVAAAPGGGRRLPRHVVLAGRRGRRRPPAPGARRGGAGGRGA